MRGMTEEIRKTVAGCLFLLAQNSLHMPQKTAPARDAAI